MFAQLSECSTLDRWQDLLFDAPVAFGFAHVMFNIIGNVATPQSRTVMLTNQPRAWQTRYTSENLSRVDPLINYCRTHYVPLVWSQRHFTSPEQLRYYEEGCELGLRSGVCLPIRGVNGETGMLNFTSSDPGELPLAKETRAGIGKLVIFRDYLLESFFRLKHPADDDSVMPKLTPRELECLRWIALGKTSWEVSRILCCAEVTVNYHVKNIMRKFNAQSRQHAVIRGLRAGLI